MALVKKPTNALGVLVDTICEANGWSGNDLVRRIEDRGYEMGKSRLGQLRTDIPLPGIQADKIQALAVGLGISPVRVALAAVEAMGFPVQDSSITPAEAISRDPHLSEDTRTALLSILRTAEERRRPA